MSNFTVVTTKGQVTIPEEIRLQLGVSTGDRIFFSDSNPRKKEAVMKVFPSKGLADRLCGSLKTKVKEPRYKVVRKEAGMLLAKKYKLIK